MELEKEHRRDELLEMLWRLSERHDTTLTSLRRFDEEQRYEGYLREFAHSGYVRLEGERIYFTDKGLARARDIVRRHRLAERLLVDVMGKSAQETEEVACEFEHILAAELVNAICTLLGHPTTCPHGLPIPEGECCQKEQQVVDMAVVPLSRVAVGQEVRIASIDTQDAHQMNRLLVLGLLPGAHMTVLQKYPTLVVQVERRQIAFEESIGNQLRVWQKVC
ncbi:MAG: metal-dependent transcriptional regulator [Magnetococcales bacterium]|nr:metal-dependent transcriptional regulator [Magnetococcales bacterium]NGZ27039.1 metal-dependent transcriptional regulator [Magnetococcales bacterium]